MKMKAILSILVLSVLGSYEAGAQTATSSQKHAQTQTVPETANAQASENGAGATLVSGEKNATVKEVPVENKEANGATTPVTTPSSKRPD